MTQAQADEFQMFANFQAPLYLRNPNATSGSDLHLYMYSLRANFRQVVLLSNHLVDSQSDVMSERKNFNSIQKYFEVKKTLTRL